MHVLIVGAGPAGVASALLLVQRGIEVTLIERERGFDRVFRGEGLMPSGVDALYQMGLGSLLADVSLPVGAASLSSEIAIGSPPCAVPDASSQSPRWLVHWFAAWMSLYCFVAPTSVQRLPAR